MNPERSLAHIETIAEKRDIPGADQIEMIRTLGWECVVKKNDGFQIGDKIVYVEIDSIMPQKPEYEFLRERKFRIRTIKLRKQISQGLVLPLTCLPEDLRNKPVGTDVTKALGIVAYDPDPEPVEVYKKLPKPLEKFKVFLLSHKITRPLGRMLFLKERKQRWPGEWLHKTDEERIQNVFNRISKYFAGQMFYVTEKLDGSSMTVFSRSEKLGKFYGLCSRNLYILKTPLPFYKRLFVNEPKGDNNDFKKVFERDRIVEKLKKIPYSVTVQGELVGPGRNGNKHQLADHDFYVFNVVKNRDGYQLSYPEMKEFCENYGFKIVPLITDSYILPENVDEIVKFSNGKSALNQNVLREGLVFRIIEKGTKRASFKAISPEFLLKHGE